MEPTRILVTGASGFVGKALCKGLVDKGSTVHAVFRATDNAGRNNVRPARGSEQVVVGDIGPATDWRKALTHVGIVVHLAARVHVMRESSTSPLAAFRMVNTAGTAHLARVAAASGVKRFIYVSTVKVNGEATDDETFSERNQPGPRDPYAISKWEAEQELHKVAAGTGLEVVIVRPPLVYGPGVKGNFRNLMRVVQRGWPLPVGGCNNRRSLLGLGNFVDFLALCVHHPAAAGQTFLVSDGEDLSTPELIRRLAAAMNRPARLMNVPPSWLRAIMRAFGRAGVYQRLCGSLQVDSSLARRVLDWVPPETVQDGLARTVDDFLLHDRRSAGNPSQ